VPNEPKGKSIDTYEGTGLKPGVHDVYNDLDQADEERTEFENQGTSNDEKETQHDEYVHSPEDYVPTDDEMNDESKDVDVEEYDRIDKELYGDVNIRLTDAKPDDEEKGTKEVTDARNVDAEHENVNQEGAGNQVKELKTVDHSSS
ncbi:hypothetical protein Tco_0961880, partial [Tanacetum coccineum]